MPAPYSAGSIFLQVVPSFRGVPEQIQREAREWGEAAGKDFDEQFEKHAVEGAKRTGDKVAKELGPAGKAAAKKFSEEFERETRTKKLFQHVEADSSKAGQKAGDAYAGRFANAVKGAVSRAAREVATIKVDVNDQAASTKLRKLQRDLAVLENSKREIGMDINVGAIMEKLTSVENGLRDLQDSAGSIDMRVNSASALGEITKVRGELLALSAIQIEPELKIDRQLGAFERGVRSALDSALRDLGTVDIGVGSNAGQRAVGDLRKRLFDLNDLEIGVDISAQGFRAELARIRDELQQLTREHWSIDLDANTAAASASLDGILAALDEVDHKDATADVEIKGVASAIAQLEALEHATDDTVAAQRRLSGTTQDSANSFRAFNVRVLGVAALGPLVVPAIGAIAGAMAALGPLAAVGGAGIGVLALGMFGIGDAFKAMGKASTESGRDLQDHQKAVNAASRSVADAERGLAQARESAARSTESAGRAVEDALRGVESAERSYQSALDDERDAQRDLQQARADAAEQLEDLQLKVRDGVIDQRQAALDLRDAEKELAEGRANGTTGDELEQLLINLEKAKLRVDQVKESNQDLTAEQDRWAKSGIEGSDVVVAAHERVQQAQERIADAERGMADAQRNLAQAREAQAQAAVDGQRQIADAQRNLADAQLSYSEAVNKSSTSTDNLADAMSKLGPAGQAFVTFLDGLRPRLQVLRGLAQEGFLPGLEDWIDSIVNFHGPLLESTIKGISGAIGSMFSSFATSIRGSEFTSLFEMINRSGPTFLGQMSQILVNLGEGVASLIVAVEPLAHLFGDWLVRATAQFSAWASNLQGSTGLTEFFNWVQRVGPKVADFFWELARALIAIGKAIAPFAEGLVDRFTAMFSWIADMDPALLGHIVVGILGLTVALQAIFGLTALVHSFRSAIHLTTDALGVFGGEKGLGAVAGKVGLFSAALVTLYTQSELVRGVINDILGVLAKLVSWVTGSVASLADLAGTLAIVGASWKGAQLLGGAIGGIGTATTNAAPGMGVFVSNLTKSDTAGTKVMNTMGKFGSVLGRVGTALPIVGIAFGLVAAAIEETNRRAEAAQNQLYGWIEATSQGGEKARDAAAHLDDYQKKIDAAGKALKDHSAYQYAAAGGMEAAAAAEGIQNEELKILQENLQKAKKKWEEYWQGLSPVEQQQALVLQAQNDLTLAVKEFGPTSDQAAAASSRLEARQASLASFQRQVADATSGLNTELQEQLGLMMQLAESELAYEQSVSSLDDAHTRAADALAQYGVNSKEYRDALLAEEQQQMAVADAAQRVAESRHQDADANIRQAYGQAAYLLELNRQKEAYGELPPRLEEIRAALEAGIDPAILVAAGFEDLGLQISRVPDKKTIILETATDAEIQKMKDLGFAVETLPDGTIQVTALTDDAAKAIEDLTRPRVLEITTHVSKAGTGNDFATTPGVAGTQGGGFNSGPVHRAGGGAVYGPGTWTSDSIPAYLSHGEYVVRAASVNKYGLDFLDAVNSGQWGPGIGFSRGGLASGGRRKNGRPAFADGGFTGAWGGSIDLSGIAIPELASYWVDTVSSITIASGRAASAIGSIFGSLRTALLSNFSDTGTQSTTLWGTMLNTLVGSTTGATGTLTGLWQNLKDNIFTRTLGIQLDVGARFGQIRDGMSDTAHDAVTRVSGHFSALPGLLTGFVNKIIDSVLNNGLFKAFNSVVGALGLDAKLNIPTAATVKLADGGKVPGYSPHAKADNIPAWLTAGEFVQPVDVVNHYGVDFMERLRRKELPRYATGGYVDAMVGAVTRQFPFARVTSTYRPGDPGYHGKRMAADFGGARPYPDPLAMQQMLQINRWIAANFSNITELIHTAPGAINLWHGKPHGYNAATQKEHRNHVHWAMDHALTGGGALDFLGVAFDAITDPVSYLRNAVNEALGDFEGNVPVKQIMGQGARKLVDLMADKVTGWVGDLFGAGADAQIAGRALTGNSAANEALVRSMAGARGWTGSEWNSLRALIMKESGFNNLAQNPSSTAYGMFQFLNSTWGGTGIGKTSDPRLQTEAGFRYIASRYGSPSKALAFHNAHNWYGDGGPVQPTDGTGAVIPDLHDTGGWLMPGLNVIMNRTGRPEPTINPQTLDALLSIADQGGGNAPAIGMLNQHLYNGPTAREAAGEMDHAATVARRGGKY